jgi:hypothetical protein
MRSRRDRGNPGGLAMLQVDAVIVAKYEQRLFPEEQFPKGIKYMKDKLKSAIRVPSETARI